MPKQTANSDARDSPLRSVWRRTPVARVLVVGKDEHVRRWACGRLRKVGFTVLATDNGIDALILAHGDPPDVIVVDHVVGWLDVRCLLTLLRRDARTVRTPILLITPRPDGVFARDCHQLGATSVVKAAAGRPLAALTTLTTASAELRQRARQC